jgi:hypothetical protein
VQRPTGCAISIGFTRREKSLWTTTRIGKKHHIIERVINETSTNNKHATTGVALSGSTLRFSRGRKPTGEQVLGKEEKLGEPVYKFNTKDQADMYVRTTEAIANFVGVEYGRDMRMLVKHGTEKTFTGPRIPRSINTTPGLMEKFKTELLIFQ